MWDYKTPNEVRLETEVEILKAKLLNAERRNSDILIGRMAVLDRFEFITGGGLLNMPVIDMSLNHPECYRVAGVKYLLPSEDNNYVHGVIARTYNNHHTGVARELTLYLDDTLPPYAKQGVCAELCRIVITEMQKEFADEEVRLRK